MRRLSDILGSSIENAEVLAAAQAQRAMRDWAHVVGPILAERTSPDRFDHGTIWVLASGSEWAQEIRLRKDVILRRLDQIAGQPGLFRDLRVGTRSTHRLRAEKL